MQTKAPTGDAQTTDTTEATTTDTVATTLATAATTTLEADTATPTTSQEPMSQAGVFSFAEHDLCE